MHDLPLKKKKLFIYFFGRAGSLSLCVGFSLWWLLSLQSRGSRAQGLQ